MSAVRVPGWGQRSRPDSHRHEAQGQLRRDGGVGVEAEIYIDMRLRVS